MHNTYYRTLIYIVYAFIIISFNACTKQTYPVNNQSKTQSSSSSSPSSSKPNDANFRKFASQGIEKNLNTGKITPDAIITSAKKFMGVPHCMGGTTRKCMDCSGLLFAVFAQHGISLPRSSQEQARIGKIVSQNNLRKGDLVFFTKTYNTANYITHSGIYLGNNEFIHTSSSQGVSITSLSNSYWKDKFVFGTRIF